MFDEQRNRLLEALDAAHDTYYRAEVFGGPSLHFHLKALESARNKDLEQFAQDAYALLASWGMHRMGPAGSKMRDFGEFYASLKEIWSAAISLQQRSPNGLNESDWDDLKAIFAGIRCMASGTSLVGNSKVMAHLIPNLVPPIDREYTLKFLFGHGQIINGIEREWDKMETILQDFFFPIVTSKEFSTKAEDWQRHRVNFKWDTSSLKIIDNLVIGITKLPRMG